LPADQSLIWFSVFVLFPPPVLPLSFGCRGFSSFFSFCQPLNRFCFVFMGKIALVGPSFCCFPTFLSPPEHRIHFPVLRLPAMPFPFHPPGNCRFFFTEVASVQPRGRTSLPSLIVNSFLFPTELPSGRGPPPVCPCPPWLGDPCPKLQIGRFVPNGYSLSVSLILSTPSCPGLLLTKWTLGPCKQWLVHPFLFAACLCILSPLLINPLLSWGNHVFILLLFPSQIDFFLGGG